jgi:hypothetical protein
MQETVLRLVMRKTLEAAEYAIGVAASALASFTTNEY